MPYGRRKQMNEDIAIINELTQQMLKQYLEADADQNDSACEHRPPLELFSDSIADTLTEHCTEEGQQEGDDAYGAEGKEQLSAGHLKAAEDYSGRKRIDARRYRHHQKGADCERVSMFLLGLIANGFDYHLAADESEQDKGYPMIESCDEVLHAAAEYRCQERNDIVADKRHGSLKHSEEKRHQQCVADAHLFGG